MVFGDLQQGTSGAEVRQLQTNLLVLGYDPTELDGVFGPHTREALIAFQDDHGVDADGIYGPQTYDAMKTALAARAAGGDSYVIPGAPPAASVAVAPYDVVSPLVTPSVSPASTVGVPDLLKRATTPSTPTPAAPSPTKAGMSMPMIAGIGILAYVTLTAMSKGKRR